MGQRSRHVAYMTLTSDGTAGRLPHSGVTVSSRVLSCVALDNALKAASTTHPCVVSATARVHNPDLLPRFSFSLPESTTKISEGDRKESLR